MREFQDQMGATWTASVARTEGPDYKGRYHLVMKNEAGDQVGLTDVEWNSERTAARTLETMSLLELKKRLRSARGRSAGV